MKLTQLIESLNERREDYDFKTLASTKNELELDVIADKIMEGGQIRTSKEMLVDNLRKAELISYVVNKKTSEVAGVGALKLPREEYKQGIFDKIGFPELADSYKYELGYFYINPKYRAGISVIKGIMEALYKNKKNEHEGIFSTLRKGGHTDRPSFLAKFGFTFIGEHDNIKVFGMDTPKISSKLKLRLNG